MRRKAAGHLRAVSENQGHKIGCRSAVGRVGQQSTHCCPWPISGRRTGLPWNLTFTDTAEQGGDGDSGHSRLADIHGASARAMIKALVAGKPMHEVLACKGRLRASREELFEALSTDQFSAVHRVLPEEIVQHIEQRIVRMDGHLRQGLKAYEPQLRLLQTIPGIDLQGAAMLLVEIGADMGSFGSAERLASWVGICPGDNESAGKRKNGSFRRVNAWTRGLLCEFAQTAARTRCALKAKFESLAVGKGHKKSSVALAHKMLRTIHSMLSSGTHCQEKTVA